MKFIYDDQTGKLTPITNTVHQVAQNVAQAPPDHPWGYIPFIDGPTQHIKDHLQGAERDIFVNPVVGTVEDIVKNLASDAGHWALHMLGPVALIVCTVWILGVIIGHEKAPKRALMWGIIACIGYGGVANHA